jgi:CRISPR-associated protein Cmr4
MKVREARYFFLTQEPVHIGAGGYRLGRVDMTICREPGTNLPKIPGTSLAGAARSYAAQRYGKPQAAGQHKNVAKEPKEKKEQCPILYTFGTASETESGMAGTVSVGDARILFFPVQSMAGPVWITTEELLKAAGFKDIKAPVSDQGAISSTLEGWTQPLNLGWLRLDTPQILAATAPEELAADNNPYLDIAKRLVALSPKLFSQVVNNNLEVRTSVAIDQETGAAVEHMLFTYEAIPRGTWLFSEAVEDDFRGKFPKVGQCFKDGAENSGDPLGKPWDTPFAVLEAGLDMIQYLGVGGMGTRGFGRMKLVAESIAEPLQVAVEGGVQ